MVNKKKSRGKLKPLDEHSLPLFSIDDYPESVPAAGWRSGSSLNNAGDNGNYWSSTPNESNTQNAYNLNFNSSNHNVNRNNRNNGQSVRPVSELTMTSQQNDDFRHFSISGTQLFQDLYRAYKDARRNKRGKGYQLTFELELEDNLARLRDELLSGSYHPLTSTCFVIHDPKMREIFAADFRDRIVHHLFYNYTYKLFERTFIYDSYSCIAGRGTHLGISRLEHHIRSVSAGYSQPCYVLKVDIRGYFMSINRNRLLDICSKTLDRMKRRESDIEGLTWGEKLDYPFMHYLLRKIICFNPIENCRMLGRKDDWNNLPTEKSLFSAPTDCGLPIGNLSSQLFSNIYLNELDQYVKRELGCRHYGRYVDDAYIVDGNMDRLKSIVPLISDFLDSRLGLKINERKTRIYDARFGVEFLGAYVRPFRTYISNSSLKRISKKMTIVPRNDVKSLQSSVNSCLGVMSHYDSYCIRKVLIYKSGLWKYGRFSNDLLRYKPFGK